MVRTFHRIDVFGRDTRTAGAQGPSWDEERYLDAMERTFEQLRRSHVGRYLLRFIEMTEHRVRIYPEPVDREPDLPPWVQPLDPAAGRIEGGARGRRSDADVFFTPGDYRRFRMADALTNGPGRFGDELLVHELVHALRCTWGVLDQTHLPWCMRLLSNHEEFCAITVTNMYRSELRRPLIAFHRVGPIREDIRSSAAEQSPRAQWERKLLARFEDQMPHFTRPLGNFPEGIVPHNPFRMYLTERPRWIPTERG